MRPPVGLNPDGYYYAPAIDGGGLMQCTPDFYSYPITFDTAGGSNIAAAGVATGNFIVQAGQYFLWQQSMFMADTAHAATLDGTRIIPNVSVQLSDQNSSNILTNAAVPLSSIFGTGQLPFVLPNPRLCMPQSVIQALLTNYDAAVSFNIRLTFSGLALRPTGQVF